MISQCLKAQQLKVGRYLVGRLMAEANVASRQRRRHQYRSRGVEAFVATEWVPAKGYSEIEEARSDMTNFFMRYNRIRLHSYNDYLSPIAKELQAA